MASTHAMYIRKCIVENPSIEASTTSPEDKSPATQGRRTQMSDPAHKGQQISVRNQHNYGENIITKFLRIIPVGTHGDKVKEKEKHMLLYF